MRGLPEEGIGVKPGDVVWNGSTFGTVVGRVEGWVPRAWAVQNDESGLVRLFEENELVLVDADFDEGHAAWEVE